MDSSKIAQVLEQKFDFTSTNYKTIHLDGEWGIGKSYAYEKFRDKIKANENFKYIELTVFGKNSVKEIEKELISQLLFPTFMKLTENKIVDATTNLVKDVFASISKSIIKNKTGVSIDPLSYIETLTVEKVDFTSISLICFDDLERMNPKIKLTNLLGLIERLSKSTNILIIGNKSKLRQVKKVQ